MFKTTNGWTKERMIKRIWEFPDRKCVEDENSLYRNTEGNACAVGRFIPEEIYNVMFEDKNILQIWDKVHNFMPLDIDGMDIFQMEHDYYDKINGINDILTKWILENVEEAHP